MLVATRHARVGTSSPSSPSGSRSASPRARTLAALVSAIAAGTLSSAGRADELQTARLALVRGAGAETCPAQDEIARLVRARAGERLLDPAAPRALEVLLGRDRDQWTAQIFVRDAAHRTLGARSLAIAGETCEPLTDAVVLAVALAIDPDAAVLAPSREPAPTAVVAP